MFTLIVVVAAAVERAVSDCWPTRTVPAAPVGQTTTLGCKTITLTDVATVAAAAKRHPHAPHHNNNNASYLDRWTSRNLPRRLSTSGRAPETLVLVAAVAVVKATQSLRPMLTTTPHRPRKSSSHDLLHRQSTNTLSPETLVSAKTMAPSPRGWRH